MPDLNSVPASPRVLATSRRASSSVQNPASNSQTSPILNILPSNQQTFSSSLPSPPPLASTTVPTMSAAAPTTVAPGQDNTGVSAGPGPLRHPRPLTAAELHSELEHEQELLVNRLTRDLSMLRAAQNSSVVSNASSASASTDQGQHLSSSFTDHHLLSGPGLPPTTSADRRHTRTNSSTSARSFSQTQGSIPPANHSGNAASVLEAARYPRAATSMSRQNSTTSHRSTSRTRSPQPFPPSLSSSYTQSHGFPDAQSSYFPRASYSHHPTASTSSHQYTMASNVATPGSSTTMEQLSPGLMPATLRYEETAHYRHELEAAKRENEALKRRIKELERHVRDRRASDASLASASASAGGVGGGGPRIRSESTTSTAAASGAGTTNPLGIGAGGASIAGDRRGVAPPTMDRMSSSVSVAGSVGVGVPEEELRVGESAASTAATATSSATATTAPADVVKEAAPATAAATTGGESSSK